LIISDLLKKMEWKSSFSSKRKNTNAQNVAELFASTMENAISAILSRKTIFEHQLNWILECEMEWISR
jgi:hypothetical protein